MQILLLIFRYIKYIIKQLKCPLKMIVKKVVFNINLFIFEFFYRQKINCTIIRNVKIFIITFKSMRFIYGKN